ncbi:hypothetical protein HanXRQr2_Chr13g0573991 [Helianthus annuus]|uniref:Reverse transcriptase zinc-binding domain-containing protein n=1 Tax=Helianthus annuus TaxID=4232 RepID=A0A9K3H915_HELAN|nr:hypothetical protein HanXRQr2_Chr13g0573991 [Helianthus annuus]KAJ0848052.1 hypothetical protein HanPSC8_Chr13g0552631 [Helianthus annuus]
MVRLSNKEDAWIWSTDKKDGFSVKSVKKTLISDRGSSRLPTYKWSKLVPIKCNIMVWRACSLAICVWAAFSDWCNIPPIFTFEFKDLMDIHNSNQERKKMKKILWGLVIIVCWCLWKARNDLVFNQHRRSSQEILIDIKSRGFGWLKNRSACKFISWKEWCKYPMHMV